MLRSTLLVPVFTFALVPPGFAQYARVSVSSAGAEANASSVSPSTSDDARFVAFSSAATNLVAGDTNGHADIYLHDRDTDADGVFDEADARTTVRVSVTTTGAEFQGPCGSPVISGSGRYVTFLTNAPLPPGVGNGGGNGFVQVLRWDRTTGAIDVVSQTAAGVLGNGNSDAVDMSNDGRLVIFRSQSTNFVTGNQGEIANIFLRDMHTGSLVRLSEPQPLVVPNTGNTRTNAYVSPSLSGDGVFAAFSRAEAETLPTTTAEFGHLFLVNVQVGPPAGEIAAEIRARLSDDGRDLMVIGHRISGGADVARHHLTTGERVPGPRFPDPFDSSAPGLNLPLEVSRIPSFVMGQDARYAVSLQEPSGSALWDLAYEQTFPLPFSGLGASFDASGRSLAIATQDALAPASADTNGVPDIYVVDLPRALDKDADTLDDRWERTFGLNDTSGAGADGPTGDPDNDGITNADEQAAGTHPRGLVRRYLAEGASGSFFTTQLALAHMGSLDTPTPSAKVIVTFLRPNAAPLHTFVPIRQQARRTMSPTTITGLESADFSMVIESDRSIAVARTMYWDTTGYGAHTETAADGPSTIWYVAEGSTVIDFNLFYLLQNPQPAPVDVSIRYLRPSGGPIVKTMQLPPNSRTTVYVNEADPLLAETDVSGVIESSAPIVVERAMYANRPNQPFALGHATKGVTTPATTWFLAEGATGPFFDTYVLIANPSTSEAPIEVRFLKPDGSSVTQTHTVPGQSRFSIFVDAVPGLEATAVSTTVASTNAVPIIVERAMYWPGGFFDYSEGHSSAGTTTTATRWVLPEGETGGPRAGQTFLLIANTSDQPGQAFVRLLSDPAAPMPNRDAVIALPANSRTTVELGFPGSLQLRRFGAYVESGVPLVVEGAFYWSPGGILWAAGSNIIATPFP